MRAFFLYLARRESFKNFALKFKLFRGTASRFIAGDTLDDAIRAVRYANRHNIRGTLDLLGENTVTREDAQSACNELILAQDRIHMEKASCNLSVKLTQLGLNLDRDFCEQNLIGIAKHAEGCGNFVRVDMEDSAYTDRTLEIVERAHALLGNVGTVIQAYLYRSKRDLARMIERGIRIRLVKGAYREPEDIAFRRKRDTDANYVEMMKLLLQKGSCPAIATHDTVIIQAAKEFARSNSIPRDSFEFQMLYGIRRDIQQQLAQEGYNVRVYIPYGSHWYPYFMRRLAERPANVIFLVRNLFKEFPARGRLHRPH